ncbi:hypothetical protein FRACYDRAFT_268492 [Fragilariopsis cylindrus CCMP1102]|uniref:Uncharacterized protein n=1 Tax=Fragilariopsis cylindrus CCMP1102 TaxID=635003 RepID=A0A1E7FL63_9STRA|nr:hypothetical protein FRACYDRAFT_268492 [Fragilariopsis cylindrus CCMP1102]|eukprot:OEU18920.1 hypothetical protein FRACYDRAFT_268492 [Fragilariopsis cylindrus CCMP1102]
MGQDRRAGYCYDFCTGRSSSSPVLVVSGSNNIATGAFNSDCFGLLFSFWFVRSFVRSLT